MQSILSLMNEVSSESPVCAKRGNVFVFSFMRLVQRRIDWECAELYEKEYHQSHPIETTPPFLHSAQTADALGHPVPWPTYLLDLPPSPSQTFQAARKTSFVDVYALFPLLICVQDTFSVLGCGVTVFPSPSVSPSFLAFRNNGIIHRDKHIWYALYYAWEYMSIQV